MTLFPERLKTLREKENLLQRELAEKLNLSRVTVTQYEQGKRTPDWDTLQKIADFFEVSTDYLLGRTDDPTPPDISQNVILALLLYISTLHQLNPVELQSDPNHASYLYEVMLKMSVGKRIKALRNKKKMTLRELSKKVGISISFLSDIENGRSSPSLERLIIIAVALDTTVSYLLGEA